MKKAYEVANDLSRKNTMLVNGQTFVCQTIVPPEAVFIINPNDKRALRKAFNDAAPTLLGVNVGNGWSYYEDAMITYTHPHSTDPDCVGLYVLDATKARIKPEGNDFYTMRQLQLQEQQVKGGRYICMAQEAQENRVVSLFGGNKKPEIAQG